MRWLAVCLTVLLATGVAWAQCGTVHVAPARVVTRQVAVVRQAVVVTPVVAPVAVFAAFPVAVPVYGAGYVPPVNGAGGYP